MIFTNPLALFLSPLAILPLLLSAQKQEGYPSLGGFEDDRISQIVAVGLRLVGTLAMTGLILGISGLSLRERTIERFGQGAHIVLLIDRSSSMDDTFAGRPPSGGQESKSRAAKRLLREFVTERANDRFGIAAFSTSPIHVLPITDHKNLIVGAIDAIDRPGLAFTDVGRGLAMALDMTEQDVSQASRAILLVSDGAAVIARRVQESLRAEFARQPVHLYWLYLRTKGTNGIFETPPPDVEDTPQVFPERHLHKFLQSLHIPYRAFEAESPEAVKAAITEIGKLEQTPIVYTERIPQYDLSRWAYGLALLAIGALLAAKAFERSVKTDRGGAHAA